MAAGEFRITADERKALTALLNGRADLRAYASDAVVRQMYVKGWIDDLFTRRGNYHYVLTDTGRTVARQLGLAPTDGDGEARS